MNIFVAKLSYQTGEDKLRSAFENYGEVSSAKIIFDKYEGRSKGYGFVEMPNDDEGKQAIEALNNSELDGRTIVVKKSEPKSSGGNRSYGGGGRNRY
jgi:RNA recognition motif-containing protein